METENTTTAAENMTVAEPETASEQVNVDDLINLRLSDGQLSCKVLDKGDNCYE